MNSSYISHQSGLHFRRAGVSFQNPEQRAWAKGSTDARGKQRHAPLFVFVEMIGCARHATIRRMLRPVCALTRPRTIVNAAAVRTTHRCRHATVAATLGGRRGSREGVHGYRKRSLANSEKMSVVSALRFVCQANGLNSSGSRTVLLKRLVAVKKTVSEPQSSKKSPKSTPLKGVRNGGFRLSARHYFYDVCEGKISRCEPQCILQPDGSVRLKKIRMVTRGNVRYARWVDAH